MAKMLNLDDFAKEQRVLKLNGETHEMKDASVGDFIEITKMTEKLEKSSSFVEQLEFTIKLCQMRFPTLKEETLRNLNFEQLNAILQFANAVDPIEEMGDEEAQKEAEAANEEAGESGEGKTES